MRVLLVEDDWELAQWTVRELQQRYGIVVEWSEDGGDADRRLKNDSYNVVALELGVLEFDCALEAPEQPLLVPPTFCLVAAARTPTGSSLWALSRI